MNLLHNSYNKTLVLNIPIFTISLSCQMLIYVQITAGGSSLAGSFNIDLFINKQTNNIMHTGSIHNKQAVLTLGVEIRVV